MFINMFGIGFGVWYPKEVMTGLVEEADIKNEYDWIFLSNLIATLPGLLFIIPYVFNTFIKDGDENKVGIVDSRKGRHGCVRNCAGLDVRNTGCIRNYRLACVCPPFGFRIQPRLLLQPVIRVDYRL